jgi:hypothetical protein
MKVPGSNVRFTTDLLHREFASSLYGRNDHARMCAGTAMLHRIRLHHIFVYGFFYQLRRGALGFLFSPMRGEADRPRGRTVGS